MKKMKICIWCVFIVELYVLTGCGASSKEQEVSIKTVTTQSQQNQGTMTTMASLVTDITRETVKEKPGVTRVVIALSQKASYATSRDGNQLIINIFNAQMGSSIKQVDVQDPIVKSIIARQVGNSVKGMIELLNQDIAYTPSTLTDPFRIVVDVWQISPTASMKQPGSSSQQTPVLATPPKSAGRDPQKTQEVSVDVRKPVGESSAPTTDVISTQLPPASTGEVPARLQWFSEKLSQLLQEREKIKQNLLDVEKNVAVKDSMILVLERKLEEANNRIVELEEDLIKTKSSTSLVEQNESDMREQLQQLVMKIEEASDGQAGTATPISSTDPKELQMRSQKVLSKISSLKQESLDLNQTKTEVSSLKAQVEALTKERDDLKTKTEAYVAEVESLKTQTNQLTSIEQQLRSKEVELAKLRDAIGNAARLVLVEPEASANPSLLVQNVQPAASTQQQQPITLATQGTPSSTSGETQNAVPAVQSATSPEDTQLSLATLIKQQQMLNQEANPAEYVLGQGDVIRIRVLNEEDLDKTVTVSSDGFITYPLLGDLRVDGLSVSQLTDQISYLLSQNFLVDPKVVVEIAKQRSKKVYIMGAVKQPGYQELQGDQRLLGTLLNAGGPNSFDAEVRILRLPKQEIAGSEQGTLSPIVVDLNKLFLKGDQSQNILLQDGDVLMVAAKTSEPVAAGMPTTQSLGPNQFYVVGSVVKPGIYDYQQGDTVLDAILRAGGFTEFASRNSTKLVRDVDGKTRTFQIKMKDVMDNGEMDKNQEVKSGDMIIVPESLF